MRLFFNPRYGYRFRKTIKATLSLYSILKINMDFSRLSWIKTRIRTIIHVTTWHPASNGINHIQYRKVCYDLLVPVFLCIHACLLWWYMTTWWQVDSLLSTNTKVNWFLARPSLSCAVYEPSSSGDSWSISISTRPLALSKLILRFCRKSTWTLTHIQTANISSCADRRSQMTGGRAACNLLVAMWRQNIVSQCKTVWNHVQTQLRAVDGIFCNPCTHKQTNKDTEEAAFELVSTAFMFIKISVRRACW